MFSKIEKRLGIFAILAAATLLTVGVGSYRTTAKLIEANRQVAQTNEVLAEISAVRAAMQGAQNNANDFVITQDERFRTQYYTEVGQSQRGLERLRVLTHLEPGQQARLDSLDPLIENAFQVFHVGMNPFPGMPLTPKEVALQRLREQESMNGVRRTLQDIEDEEHDLLNQRNAVAAQQARGTKTVVFLGTMLALVILALATMVLHRDIAERRKTEFENLRLVTAIEQSAEGVMITDTDGSIEYVNPAFTSISGFPASEALGKTPSILNSGKQSAEYYQQLWTTILRGEIWRGELINRRQDGTLYTELMSITPVRGARDEITHFIATKQDVTERKSLEAQLRQSQKMEAVGQLAGGVAHDFNNLLTVISGYGHLLQDRLDTKNRPLLEEIIKASDRAASLTRQLLAFSRRQILNPQVLDLNALVANLEKMLRRLIGEDIQLATVQQRGLGMVKADPGQIEQVVINLAVNSRDAMPKGGKLTLETANVDLDENYARTHTGASPGPHVMLAVSDTGVGMTPEVLARIFEPFFTTKEKGKGTGLGLATAYGIVKQSSGSIWVYSEPGRGTTFKIYLPRLVEPPPQPPGPPVRSIRASGTETILVVEDEDGVRSLVCLTLKSKGYRVLEAREAGEALSLVRGYSDSIHMLLTDVVMPHMSGKELADRLVELHPEALVMYMSGYTDDAVVRHGILEAHTHFLQKPFTPHALAQKVRDVLDTRHKSQG